MVHTRLKHAIVLTVHKDVLGYDILIVGVYIPPEGPSYHEMTAFKK